MLSDAVREEVDLLAGKFSQALPFRHICIDGFFDDVVASRMLEEFPSFAAEKAINEVGEVGLKASTKTFPLLVLFTVKWRVI
jgi:hypothetical protein